MRDCDRTIKPVLQSNLDATIVRSNPRVTRGLSRADIVGAVNQVGTVNFVLGEMWRRDEQDDEWFQYRHLSDGVLRSNRIAVSVDGRRYFARELVEWPCIFDKSGQIVGNFAPEHYHSVIHGQLFTAVAASQEGWIIVEMIEDVDAGSARFNIWSTDTDLLEQPQLLSSGIDAPTYLTPSILGVIGSGFECDYENEYDQYVIIQTDQPLRYGYTSESVHRSAQVGDQFVTVRSPQVLNHYAMADLDLAATEARPGTVVEPLLETPINGWLIEVGALGDLLVTLESSKFRWRESNPTPEQQEWTKSILYRVAAYDADGLVGAFTPTLNGDLVAPTSLAVSNDSLLIGIDDPDIVAVMFAAGARDAWERLPTLAWNPDLWDSYPRPDYGPAESITWQRPYVELS